jgi:RNA polymerase sigma-70 factor (ECF subfamily)
VTRDGDQALDAAGQRDVLVGLVRAYTRPLTRFFARRARIAADVPDLVQDVFLRLARMPEPAAIRRPESLVFVTAANVLKDRARRGRVRGEDVAEPLDEDDVEGSDFAPDRVLEGKEAIARVREALLELPERTRDVFVMRMLEGMRMAEVAAAMGISTRAAEKHQARALAHITRRLHGWR